MILIPTFHASNKCAIKGKGEAYINSMADSHSSGIFIVKADLSFDPDTNDYPEGSVLIDVDLSDSLKGIYKATSIEHISAYGKHTPTSYVTGRCKIETSITDLPKGLRFWLMIANNKSGTNNNGTPDIVGFAILDSKGKRIAHGTGAVRKGDLNVDHSEI